MMSEITIGETPMETSFVGASAAPSQAPAVRPERMPSTCSLRARDVSWAAVEFWGVNADSMSLHLKIQRMIRSRSRPPTSTMTGTQK